jgi:hypothetical protein
MDAFESIVATILEAKGFWVRRSVRVQLEKSDRRSKSAPRTELDIVAYCPATNELWMVECKSWLDSRGVKAKALMDKGHPGAKRFKLFHDDKYCNAVKAALVKQLKLSANDPKVRLCLVAGKIAGRDFQGLKDHFEKQDWILHDAKWVQEGVKELAIRGYENDIATMTAKILRHGKAE